MKINPKRSRIASRVTIAMILVALVTVAFTLIYSSLYEDSYFAEKKFEELARSYYENTLYDKFISEHRGENLADAFKLYSEHGFEIKLRQILNNEFLKSNQNYRSYFETENYSCDTNSSVAKFIPYSPYGKGDYHLDLKLDCSKI